MFARSALGLLSSGGVLFTAGALGLTATWSLVAGTLLLTTASLLLAVALEDRVVEPRAPRPWSPDGGTPLASSVVDLPTLPPLERAA